MKCAKGLFLLMLALVACQTTLPPDDKTPPIVGLEVYVNGERVELGADLTYAVALGDEIQLLALGQDEQGLRCTHIWGGGGPTYCGKPDSNLSCTLEYSLAGEPPCGSDAKPGDAVPTTLADTREITIDSSECTHSCGTDSFLVSKKWCYWAFARNYGLGSDEETYARTAQFCYEYDAD